MIAQKKLLTGTAAKGFIVRGRSVLSKPPLWDSPAEIVSPNSFTLTGGGKSVTVAETLRSVDDLDGNIAVRDYIKVEKGQVSLVRSIAEVVMKGTENWGKLSEPSYGGITWSIFRVRRTVAVSNTGLCTHFPHVSASAEGPEGNVILYPRLAEYNCSGQSGEWIYIRVSQSETGITDLADFTAWLAAEYAAGTPVTFLCSRAAAVTDITDTPLGQGLLGLRGYNILSSNGNVEIEVIR